MRAPYELSLSDSEVGSIAVEPGGLTVSFSAAAVRRSGESGFLRGLRLRLEDVSTVNGVEGLGSVREGRLWIAGRAITAPRLPFGPAGPVRIELVFHNGVVFGAEAASAVMQLPGDPDFVLSYAC